MLRTPSLLAVVVALALRASSSMAQPAPAPSAAPATEEARDAAILSDGNPTDPPPKQSGIPFYEELVKKSPEDPDAHQLLAAAFARAGKTDEARREARRAIELAPNSAETHQALGLIEEGANNLAAAEEQLKTAAALDGNVEYRLDLARLLHLQSKSVEADAAWEQIAVDFADNVDVQFALADAMRELGNYEGASAAYQRALALTTEGSAKRIDILVEHGRMLADRADNARALEMLTRARSEAPKDADVHYNLAVLYVRLGRQDAAVTSFKEAIKLKPDLAKAHNNLGVALDKLARHDEAMAAFAKAVAVDPRFADALYNYGLIAFKLRKFKEARASFEKALVVAPEMGDAKFYLGEVYYQLGDSSKALRVYKEALRMNPEDASSHRRLGDIYLEKGDVSLAVGEYWAAVDADEKDAANRAQLIRVLLVRNEEGDVRRAVKLGEKGLELDPAVLDVRIALAEAEVQQGRSPRARQVLEEGTRVMPAEPRVHVALGNFLLDQGSLPEAQQEFDQALKLDPRSPHALAAAGKAADLSGDSKTAMKLIKEALAIDATLPDARAELGRMLFLEGKNAEALKELGRASEDAPKLGKAWFYLAFAQNKAGLGAGAVEKSLKKAVENQPDLAEAHYQLGCIALGGKRIADAKKSFEAAVTARPSYEEPRTYLELIANGAAPAQCTQEKK